MKGKLRDLTGQKFGRLTVIKREGKNKQNRATWLCKCDCGNELVTTGFYLVKGDTQSCGCLSHERHKKYNEFYIHDNTVFVKFGNCNEYFLCDLEDWERLKNYYWFKDKDGYAISNIRGKTTIFHRLVLDCPDGLTVDHIYQVSRGVCDNRKSNLRIATYSQNRANSHFRSDNTSGCIGVTFHKGNNKWRSYITVNGKHIHLGYFDNVEDAAKARKQAEIEYFGEFRGCA